MRSKTRYSPILAEVTKAKIAGDEFKKQPIQSGYVRVERHSYSYGQQGQVSLLHYDIRDLPEYEAINWLSGEHVSVQWPDGSLELFDLVVTPCRFHSALENSFGYILRDNGDKAQVKLSRLPNVAVEYYRPALVTAKERETFTPHVW